MNNRYHKSRSGSFRDNNNTHRHHRGNISVSSSSSSSSSSVSNKEDEFLLSLLALSQQEASGANGRDDKIADPKGDTVDKRGKEGSKPTLSMQFSNRPRLPSFSRQPSGFVEPGRNPLALETLVGFLCVALVMVLLGSDLSLMHQNGGVDCGGGVDGSSEACDDADVSAAALPLQEIQLEVPPCKQVPAMISNYENHYKVNELRRRLLFADKKCLQKHHDLFVEEYKRHFANKERKHINLHIPKTGGTSICDMAKSSGMVTSEYSKKYLRNCWLLPYRPVWAAGPVPPQQYNFEPDPTCDDFMDRYGEDSFIGNEQYLRHPLCNTAKDGSVVFEYSVTLRDPVDRAISHINHLLDTAQNTPQKVHYENISTFARRINWIQSNYMVWSFMAGLETDPFFVVPKTELHMERALSTMYKFDYILDLSRNSCLEPLLRHIGVMNSKNSGSDLHRTLAQGIDGEDEGKMPSANKPAAKSQDADKKKVEQEQDKKEENRQENGGGGGSVLHANAASSSYKKMFVHENYEAMNQLDIILYKRALEIMQHDCEFYQQVFSFEA